MSNFTHEMGWTLFLKLILLVLLWVVCVKGHRPHLREPQQWFFGQENKTISIPIQKVSHDSHV